MKQSIFTNGGISQPVHLHEKAKGKYVSIADTVLGSQDIQVEEFVPERMKVTATPKRDEVLAGDKVAFDIAAQYLFGGNAMDSGVELTCNVEPTSFAPAENGDLTYGVEPKGAACGYLETLLAHPFVREWEKAALAETTIIELDEPRVIYREKLAAAAPQI